MIKNSFVDAYAGAVSPVVIFQKDKLKSKLIFMSESSKKFAKVCKLYAESFIFIASDNPKKVESIVVDGVRIYFSSERKRKGDSVLYIFHFLYEISDIVDSMFKNVNFATILYDIYNIPDKNEMCPASCALSEYVNSRHTLLEFHAYFLSEIANKIFDPNIFDNENFFYKINDAVTYFTETYFPSDSCPFRFRINQITSDMYTQINLNMFLLFLMNLYLVLSKYSLRTIDINFENNITRLEIYYTCDFHNTFFLDNSDLAFEEDICVLSPNHPAFSDFEFLKRLANIVGAKVTLHRNKHSKMIYKVSLSKIDTNFYNLLRSRNVGEDYPSPEVYVSKIPDFLKNFQ